RMLEAQFKPRFLFEYRNIAPGGWYELGAQNNPFSQAAEPARFYLNPGEKNHRYFEEIDLSPYLNEQGKGIVSFNADVALLSDQKRKNSEEFVIYRRENKTSIQVTDLGITARYGFNKAAVLVSKLSTGEPVEGAKVRLLSPSVLEAGYAGIPELEDFGNALTDNSGLAVIPLETGLLRDSTRGEYSYSPPYILAEKDGDMAVFDASSHNLWAFGVNASSPQRAEEAKAVTFLFSDRGIYKPGEELSFRGVDRSLVLGMYTIYQGSYTVTLEEDSYESNTVSAIQGEVSGSGGFYGKIVLSDELRPGSYRLVYRRGGSGNSRITASHPVQVAFFERLKFQASIGRPEAQVIAGEDISVSLSASYLSGGSLAGSSWESYWYRQSVRYRPEGAAASSYSFGPLNAYDGQRNIDSARGALGADGTAQLKTKTEGQTRTGAPYRYSVEANVTDISSQTISAEQSVIVHPASFYLGLARAGKAGFARKGEEVSFDYIALTPYGEKAGKNLYLANGEDGGKMNLELIREDWNRVQQQGVGGYIYDQYVRDLVTEDSRKLNLEEKGSFRVKPSGAGYYTIRISSRDREGRQIITENSFYVTGSGGGYWNRNNAAELRLIPDRDLYDPGETATVMLQSVIPSGWYLITVEREGIFTEEVRRFTEPVSTFEIPVAANYVPVVYVSISSYSVREGPPSHNYGSPDLDKPKGYFGVTKVFVNKRIKAFTVKVESDKKSYRPGEEVNLTLKAERGGKALSGAELTLMAVDRGVLDLIDYHVPDPINYFYDEERFPLSVGGGDSRSSLMDPVTYNVKNLAGGDEGKLEERKDFNPTAVFEPMLLTGKDGTVRFSFKLPDTLTTYRLTVFGVMGDLFAIKETEIASQNRINVREVLPRRLRERDTAEAGVLISNLDGKAHKISVSLGISPPRQELNNPSGRIKVSGEAFIDGKNEHTITVQSGENAVVYFDLAARKEGTVALEFSIKSEILNEKLVNEIQIEHPYVRETVSSIGVVSGMDEDGKPVSGRTSSRELIVIPGFADNGVGSLSLSLDATRLSLLNEAVKYIFHYPYGCMEQRSAAVLPLVIFGEYLDIFGLNSEVADPKAAVEAELKRWVNVQLPGGGFPYWPNGTRADLYVSIRIAHILALARIKGYNVPAALKIDDLGKYIEQNLYRFNRGDDSYYYVSYLDSYGIYALSLLGRSVDPAKLTELLARDNVDASALAFTGLSYLHLGRRNDAQKTAERLRNLMRLTSRGVDITDPLDRYRYRYYGSSREQLALSLEFFSQLYPGDLINTRLLHSLLESKRSASYWESTAVTVRVLSAVDALIRSENLASTDLEASSRIGGAELLSGAFKGLAALPKSGSFDFRTSPLNSLQRDALIPLEFERRGNGNLYYSASLSYALPPELQGFRDEGFGVFMSIRNLEGEEISGTALESGKTYRARVRLSSSHDRNYVALRIPIPSGAEILDPGMVSTPRYEESKDSERGLEGRRGAWLSNKVILDNEIQYFWDSFAKGESTVEFLFRTPRRGVYPTPPVQAECMYEAEIFGRSRGLLYTIE
ncbi:MAG: alpha-2-macroglobulin, partial [Treponema sp.]|nr:alpha-2-macroglobulin [Treponema sp.]